MTSCLVSLGSCDIVLLCLIHKSIRPIAIIPILIQSYRSYQRPFTITGSNPSGAVRAELAIRVRKGQCRAEGFFPITQVGETAVYECANQGNYIGTQKRACVLGASDGEWEKPTGACLPIFSIIVLVVVVILIVAVVVYLLVRISRKRRAVGGVKTKKNAKKNGKAETKKTSVKKNVKV